MYAIRRFGIYVCGKTEKWDMHIPNVLVAYIYILKIIFFSRVFFEKDSTVKNLFFIYI